MGSESEKQRAKRLLDNFKLTVEKWECVHTHQKGVCFICGRPNYTNKRLSTDHSHLTGLFRGLLCQKCNPLVGKLENAFIRLGLHKVPGGITLPAMAKRIAEYLENPPSVQALGYEHFGYKGKVGTKKHRKLLKKLKKNGYAIQTSLDEKRKKRKA